MDDDGRAKDSDKGKNAENDCHRYLFLTRLKRIIAESI
jgi:hypothetical protein